MRSFNSLMMMVGLTVGALVLAGAADAPDLKGKAMLNQLDGDGNGLYDAQERKVLLDVLQKRFPKIEGTFDADGDGKVTVEEQSRGRHPISMTLLGEKLTGDSGIPWAIDIFPEWIMTAYLQQDAAEGNVVEHASRGTIEAPTSQPAADLQPRKANARGGVEFAANSGQHLSMKGQRDARISYRWCIFTFRIDGESGNGKETILLDLNRGDGSNKSSPKIWYSKDEGLNIQYVGLNEGGLDRRVMTTRGVIADGRTWNVVVCGIRYGQMFASVNGVSLTTVKPQPERFCGEWPQGTMSFIGDDRKDNMAWAYDALVFGLTEPSEEMVRKMTGWAAHRLGFQRNLPADHPYRERRPVLDQEDLPYRYVHDDEKWNAWGQALKKDITRVNAGGARVEPKGFERVFYDDFRADRIKASTSGEGDLWVGPGFNISVGVDAPLVTPGRTPNTYPHDADKKQQTLSLIKERERWRGSAIYTVNDLGHGYTWTGPKVFRIRCMFTKHSQEDLPGGLFPAFWSYGPEFLFWRTANRIEVDWFEFDGKNGDWLNGLSSHVHYAHVENIFAKNPKSYQRYKVYSGELTEEKSKIPGGVFFWDGQFHTWEFVVDEDMTYVNVTVPDKEGKEKWVEVCRCPTPQTYLERLDLQLDYALKAKDGVPKDREDFVVDFVEVLQKSDEIARVPEPFTARPTLSATDKTVKCDANVKAVSDIRYYWYADGYPLTYGPKDSYTLSDAEMGKEIRCMVKAVGARDMPEAWSEVLVVR